MQLRPRAAYRWEFIPSAGANEKRKARDRFTPRRGVILDGHPVPPREKGLYLPAMSRTNPKKKRKETDNPREGWEDGTPPPHRDFKERGVVR